MNVDTFLRLFPQRCPQIMWFVGAGASASANIPTAGQMVWDFKRQIYCSRLQIDSSAFNDLNNQQVQRRIQGFLDDSGEFPRLGDAEEYPFYFEKTFPAERDRQAYIASKIRGGRPSIGHLALAELLRIGAIDIVWTTNFDRVVEDAAARAFGSTVDLAVAALGEPELALQVLNSNHRPLLVKLHGDFRSQRLKNTTGELRFQDEKLRRAFTESCRRYGLAVIGYSGRDDSIMDTLEEAVSNDHSFPGGLFWFHRSGSTPYSRITQLIEGAKAAGVNAELVEIETFDELLGGTLNMVPGASDELRALLGRNSSRMTPSPPYRGKETWPLIRLNGLPILAQPAACRRIVCNIGGVKEVKAALSENQANAIGTRSRSGVLIFGHDDEIEKAFGSYSIQEWNVHPINVSGSKLGLQESQLLYEALCRAIARERPVNLQFRRSGNIIVIDSGKPDIESYGERLLGTCGTIHGHVPGTSVNWSEASVLKIEHRFGRLWLMIEPTIWLDQTNNESEIPVAKEFKRRRLAARFNKQTNEVLDGWIRLIVGDADSANLCSLGISNGIDAKFVIGGKSALSWSREKWRN